MSSLAMCMLVFWIFFELLPGSTFRLQVDFLVAPLLPPFFSSGFLLEMKEERRKVWKKELKNDGGDAAKYKVKFEGAG